jgi:predicted Zn-dependent protease with MMP-like domain
VPLYRSRAQQFDDLVLEAVARLEPRWETELSDVEFAVQEVPDADLLDADGPGGLGSGLGSGGVPLARVVRGSLDTSDPSAPASGPRIVLFRRPLLARAEDEEELSELVFDVVVEEFAEILGIDPETVDPGYGDPGLGLARRLGLGFAARSVFVSDRSAHVRYATSLERNIRARRKQNAELRPVIFRRAFNFRLIWLTAAGPAAIRG